MRTRIVDKQIHAFFSLVDVVAEMSHRLKRREIDNFYDHVLITWIQKKSKCKDIK